MGWLKEVKERRMIPLMGTYLVGGFVAVEAVSQLVSSDFFSPVATPIVWVLYLYGVPSSLVFAWFHGAPGRQHGPRAEIALQSSLAALALVTTLFVYQNRTIPPDLAAESGLSPTSIAVLYFEDVSPGGDLGYVADGITEALIDQLSDVRSLDVVSSNGVRPFRDLSLRSDSIARTLGVGTLVEGSVDQSRASLRITTRLVDGFSGADIERRSIEIPAGEFLAARDSVAEGVSRLLRQRLGEDVRLRELRSGTRSVEAWALAQRAEQLMTDAEDTFEGGGSVVASVDAYRRVDSLLDLAERVDPEWSRPPAERARAAYRRAYFAAGMGDVETAGREIEIGFGHAARALDLNPDDATALEQRGTLRVLTASLMASGPDELARLLDQALSDLEAAVREDPSLATAHAMASFAYVGQGDNIGAVLSARRALEEDAYLRGAERIYDRLFYAQYDEERFQDAEESCTEGYRRFPDDYRFTECQLWLMTAPGSTPDFDRGWELVARLDTLAPEPLRPYKSGVGRILVAGILRNAGLPDSASSVLARVDHGEQVDVQRNLFQYEAAVLATTGDVDEEGAIAALRRWIAMTPGVSLDSGGDRHWWWRNIRDRPEFQQFVEPVDG